MKVQTILSLLLACLFALSFGCMSKKEDVMSTTTFVNSKKYLDQTYLRQADRLERCLLDLQPHIYDRIDHYKNLWINEAVTDILSMLSQKDQKTFHALHYKECIELIAEHNANRFICRAFEIAVDEEDMLLQYVLEEYETCTKHKKSLQKNPLHFDMPQVGVGNLKDGFASKKLQPIRFAHIRKK